MTSVTSNYVHILDLWIERWKFYHKDLVTVLGMLHMVSNLILQHLDLYGLNIKVLRIDLLQIIEDNMINIKEDFAPACCDNYIIMVKGKYIYTLVFGIKIIQLN